MVEQYKARVLDTQLKRKLSGIGAVGGFANVDTEKSKK